MLGLCLLAPLAGCRDEGPMRGGGAGAAPPPSAAAGEPAGWSRVIVELRLEGESVAPRPPEDAARRARIAVARQRLLAALPAAEFRLTRGFDTIPYVALAVSPAGLAALRASPLVAGVREDRLMEVQGEAAAGSAGEVAPGGGFEVGPGAPSPGPRRGAGEGT